MLFKGHGYTNTPFLYPSKNTTPLKFMSKSTHTRKSGSSETIISEPFNQISLLTTNYVVSARSKQINMASCQVMNQKLSVK